MYGESQCPVRGSRCCRMRTLGGLWYKRLAGECTERAPRRPRSRCVEAFVQAAGESTAGDKADGWQSLFDGRTLDGWKIPRFGGEGEVSVAEGRMILDFGASMTGATYTREFPKTDYEFRLEAQRVGGSDFFCAVTFPVDQSHCSFIVGGWGGGVVGLSSIDGFDASENETTSYRNFQTGQWYRIRVRVSRSKIQAWIDDKQMVDQEISDRVVSTRIEVELNKPFGLATWETKGALRNIAYRLVKDD